VARAQVEFICDNLNLSLFGLLEVDSVCCPSYFLQQRFAHHGTFIEPLTDSIYLRIGVYLQPPPKSKGGKMLSLINWRLKVTINDGRAFIGQMLAFDRHMNLVLAECEEFRRIRPKKKPGEETAPEQEMKRTLGLVILRGETVVSITVEGPPPIVDDDKKNAVSFLKPCH